MDDRDILRRYSNRLCVRVYVARGAQQLREQKNLPRNRPAALCRGLSPFFTLSPCHPFFAARTRTVQLLRFLHFEPPAYRKRVGSNSGLLIGRVLSRFFVPPSTSNFPQRSLTTLRFVTPRSRRAPSGCCSERAPHTLLVLRALQRRSERT